MRFNLQREEQAGNLKAVKNWSRQLWVLNGVLDYKIDFEPLYKLLCKFEQHDVVPKHYAYPELF